MIYTLRRTLKEYSKKRHLEMLVKRGLQLGKNVQIEGDVHLDPSHCFLIRIEDNCFLGPGVTILAHDAGPFRYIGITKIAKVVIRENCGLGTAAVITAGVTVGPNSIVGAYAVVTRDVPPNTIVAGSPARVVSSLDDYLARHKADEKKYRTFHESEYNIRWITEGRKKEMLKYLEDHPMAYMRGETPDVDVFNP